MALEKIPYDSRASTEDMANALRNASAGTDAQKFKDLQNYNINTQAPVQRGLMEEMLKEGYGQTTSPSYASPLGSLEDYMSGFREFEQNNPYSGAGTAAMMPATLPGGFRYDFTGSQQANKFNDYLESIGQAPYERYNDESMIKKFANGGGIGTMMQPKKNFKMQGGVKNYLGNQKQVKAPLNWQSSPDHPKTELAYITKKEKDLLIKKDLHNSLNGSANKGPSGIISLNGFGSNDSSQNVSGSQMSAAETGGSGAAARSGMTQSQANDIRSAAINAGAGQRVNPRFFDSRTFLSPEERARAKAYRNDPRNTFANQSFRNTGQSGIMNFIKSGGLMGNLVRSLGQRFGFGKKYDDTSTSISEDFSNNLGLDGINPATFNVNPNKKIQNTSFTQDTMPKANITGMNNITGGMAPNDYDVGNLGIDNNDFSPGNPGQYATADMINEFGDGRMGNINDEFGYSPEFQAGLINEFQQSPEFRTGLINEFAENNVLAGNADQGFVNDPYGTSDQGFVNDPYGTSDQGFQGIGETIASNIINSDIAPQFQDLVSQAGINDAQKNIIDQAIDNAKQSGTEIPSGIYDQAKLLDTQAKSGTFGFGKQEADPMTSAEYKDYLVSQGYI